MDERPKKGRRAKKRRSGRSARASNQPLVTALTNPTRVEALRILTERVASPGEISDQLQILLQNVSYHIKVLANVGLIELTEEKQVGGVVAHFYKAVESPLVDNPKWENLDPNVRSAFSGLELETLIGDAAQSLAMKFFDRRSGRQLTRKPLLLDESGWRDVSKIQAEAIEDILRVQAEAEERMRSSDTDTDVAIPAIIAMLLFEMPPGSGSSEKGEP